jgi:hypothetical protein
MTEKERERLIAILDRLNEELRRGDDRAVLLALDWLTLNRLPDAALAEAVLALGERFPPREDRG